MNAAQVIREEYAAIKPRAYQMLKESPFADPNEDLDRVTSVQAGVSALISESILLYAFREDETTVSSVEDLCEKAEGIIYNKLAVRVLVQEYLEQNADTVPSDVRVNYAQLHAQLRYGFKRVINKLLNEGVKISPEDLESEPSDADLLKIAATENDAGHMGLLKKILKKRAA